MPAGEYKVSVIFNGNDNYKKYTRYTTLNITKSFATFNVFAQDVEYGSNIKVLVSADLDGKATIKIDEETKTINLQANNEVEVIFSTLAIGKYKIYSTFSPIDSNNYYEEIDESNVEVTKIENIDVEIPNTVQNEDNVLSFNLPSDATGTITITINGNDYSTEVENGVVNIDLPDLINGNYDYTITYSGDEKYSSFTNDGSITVNNVISTVKARNMTINYGNEIDFQATFFESDGSPLVNKYIVFMIGSTEYPVKTDANGLAILQIGLDPGEYNITSINTKTDETKLNRLIVKSVEPKPIDEKDINVPALSGGFGTIKLPNDASGTIILNIAGKNYDFAVVNGVTNIKVPELANGNYPYIIKYSGDSKYSSFSKTGTLTVNKQTTPAKPVTKTTLTLKKVTVKRSAKKLTIQATLKVNGKGVKNKIIKFKFNKKTYKARTNAKGVAKITVKKSVLKKLKKGKKVTYTATYGKITKKVTVKVK